MEESRTFVIDKSQKPNCLLPAKDNVIEIKIKKEKQDVSMVGERYQYIKVKTSENEKPSFVVFEAGYVDNMRIWEGARECGIAKILMLLFLNEKELHDVLTLKIRLLAVLKNPRHLKQGTWRSG